MEDFAAMQAALEALTSANHRPQAKIEAMESDNKRLQRKVTALEKYVSKPDEERGEDVDAAGRQALGRRLAVFESAERFLGRSRDTAAAAAADQQPATVSELREFEALEKEKHREHEAKLKELEGEISKATERKVTSSALFSRGSMPSSRP